MLGSLALLAASAASGAIAQAACPLPAGWGLAPADRPEHPTVEFVIRDAQAHLDGTPVPDAFVPAYFQAFSTRNPRTVVVLNGGDTDCTELFRYVEMIREVGACAPEFCQLSFGAPWPEILPLAPPAPTRSDR